MATWDKQSNEYNLHMSVNIMVDTVTNNFLRV